MKPVSTSEFLKRVGARCGVGEPHAAALTEATLAGLGRQLRGCHAAALAEALPRTLAHWVLEDPPGGPVGVTAFLTDAARGEAGGLAVVAQHAAAVCSVLAETLAPRALREIREALPADVAAWIHS